MKLPLLSFLLFASAAHAASYIGDQTFSASFATSDSVNVVGDLTLATPGSYTAGNWNVVGRVRFAQPGDYYFIATNRGIAATGNLTGPATGRATVHVNYRTSATFVGAADSNLRLIDETHTTPLPPPNDFAPPPAAPLMNLSTRVTLNAGGMLTVGFVVGGGDPRRVLVRAIGPGLAAFGVSGALQDPRLSVVSGSLEVGANDDWGGGAALGATFATVGAFGLPPASRDAASLITLRPGAYTVVTRGGSESDAGDVLVEVYFVD